MTLARDLGYTVTETDLPREALLHRRRGVLRRHGRRGDADPIDRQDHRSAPAAAGRSPKRCSARSSTSSTARCPTRTAGSPTSYPDERVAADAADSVGRADAEPRLAERQLMHVNDLLKIAVDSGASDLHLKVGSFPMMRVRGALTPATEDETARPRGRRRDERGRDVDGAAPEVQGSAGSRPRLQRARPRPLPLQHLPAARHRRPGAARHPDADPDDRRARPAAGAQDDRRRGARPGARHRHDRQRQEHHAGGDDRPHQHRRARRT